VAFFVHGEEEVAAGCEAEVGDVLAMGEWKSIGFVTSKSVSSVFSDTQASEELDLLNQVENGHPVANGREEVGAIWTEQEVTLTVDSAEQVRELIIELECIAVLELCSGY
jgi:hypothetical protein